MEGLASLEKSNVLISKIWTKPKVRDKSEPENFIAQELGLLWPACCVHLAHLAHPTLLSLLDLDSIEKPVSQKCAQMPKLGKLQ